MSSEHPAAALRIAATPLTGDPSVWEHNSSSGDARATRMGVTNRWNAGQLVRERHGILDTALGVLLSFAVPLVTAVCAGGCQPNLDRPSTTSTTGAVVGATDATHRLTRARCDRELLCNDIGEGKEFEDWNGCEAKNLAATRVDLESAGCKKGIGERYLLQCLAALREEPCAKPLESLDRVQICRRGKLCAD